MTDLPRIGDTVIIHGAKTIRVEIQRIDTSKDVPGFAVISGYRIYANGCMSDRPHSYPVKLDNVSYDENI